MVSKEEFVALAEFRKAMRKFLHFAEEGARELGLTPQQHQMLLVIAGQPGRDWASVGEISDALQIKPHAAVGLVDRCQAAGLASRSQSSADRRVVRIELTQRGAELLERMTVRNLPALQSLGSITSQLQDLSRLAGVRP